MRAEIIRRDLYDDNCDDHNAQHKRRNEDHRTKSELAPSQRCPILLKPLDHPSAVPPSINLNSFHIWIIRCTNVQIEPTASTQSTCGIRFAKYRSEFQSHVERAPIISSTMRS